MSTADIIGIFLAVIGIVTGVCFGISRVKKNNIKIKDVGNIKADKKSKVELSNIEIGNINIDKNSGE